MNNFFLSVLVLVASIAFITCEIHDPLNIFCGPLNCYDVLGIEKNATVREIKKAYRKLSVTMHPDKSLAENATVVFQGITKAYEVLSGNESKPLFDYYLANPRDYFKVSGQHYMRNMPKSDARLVIFVALLLVSFFLRHIQYGKYQKVVKFLTEATAADLPLKMGGTPQTQELFKRAQERFEKHAKEAKLGNIGRMKMLKHPDFLRLVDEVVAEVKIEGGYRKPEWNEFLLVQIFFLPLTVVQFAQKYHRRYISKAPLSMEDKLDMARSRVGLGSWEYLPESEREKLLEMEIWKEEVYQRWVEERQAEEAKRLGKKMAKQNRRKGRSDEGDEEDTDYIE